MAINPYYSYNQPKETVRPVSRPDRAPLVEQKTTIVEKQVFVDKPTYHDPPVII